MSKFNIGDRVRIVETDKLVGGKEGIILDILLGEFPYEVLFSRHDSEDKSSFSLMFKEDELVLVRAYTPMSEVNSKLNNE